MTSAHLRFRSKGASETLYLFISKYFLTETASHFSYSAARLMRRAKVAVAP
ncbi:UNVERIFIED_ORG: hypothetical protein J2W85_002719 [Ensifer adhaerens]|nr:hypothetical protein [Ensifer adhaerens]